MKTDADQTDTAIRFEADLKTINAIDIVQLPRETSALLPSRGQVYVVGEMNGREFDTVLEPDGRGGHWFRVLDDSYSLGDTVTVAVNPSKQWPEPNIPNDFQAALNTAPEGIRHLWKAITPMARWEWVRWINETANQETRKRRIEVSLSKMQSGKRRPCCFNLSACTDPAVSKSGRLIEAE